MQPPPSPNLEAIREVVYEVYEPNLRQVGCPKFYKPYPEAIDRENPYPMGYRIPKFSLFSRKDRQFTLEDVVSFTMQCEELAN